MGYKDIQLFQHYKDLEPGKWVKVGDIEGEKPQRRRFSPASNDIKKIKQNKINAD